MKHNNTYSTRFSDLTAWRFESRPRWFWQAIAWLRSWVKTATVQGVILAEALGEEANGSMYSRLVADTICDALHMHLLSDPKTVPVPLLSQTIQQTNQLLQDEINVQELQAQPGTEHQVRVMITVAYVQSKLQLTSSSLWQKLSHWWFVKKSNVHYLIKALTKMLHGMMKLRLAKTILSAPESSEPSSHAISTEQIADKTKLSKQNTLYIAHLGKSRAYLLRDQEAYPLTVDHTRARELYAAGNLQKSAMQRHPGQSNVRRYLGIQDKAQPLVVDTQLLDPMGSAVQREYLAPFIHLESTDAILLCASGIPDMLTDEEIQDIVAEYPPAIAARSLSRLANLRGRKNQNSLTVTLLQHWSIKQWLQNIRYFLLALLDPRLMRSSSRGKTIILSIINILLFIGSVALLVVAMLLFVSMIRDNFFVSQAKPSLPGPQSTTEVVSSMPPTETLSHSVTATDNASALPQVPPSAMPASTTTPTAAALPTETAMTVITQTATPTATLTPLPLIIYLLKPETGANSSDLQEFVWRANQAPPAGQEFQIIFTEVGQSFANGFGISPSTAKLEAGEPIPLNQLDIDLGAQFEPRTYLWGVCLVDLAPYAITDQCSEGRQFTFIRAGAS